MNTTIKQKDNVYKLKAEEGYLNKVSLLVRMEDTGNGYIFKFPSYSSTQQDNYICLDYSEAEYINKILNHISVGT